MTATDVVLREKTYKEPGIAIDRRVFHTLADDQSFSSCRSVKAVSLLVKLLVDKKILTENEIDALLLECATYTR